MSGIPRLARGDMRTLCVLCILCDARVLWELHSPSMASLVYSIIRKPCPPGLGFAVAKKEEHLDDSVSPREDPVFCRGQRTQRLRTTQFPWRGADWIRAQDICFHKLSALKVRVSG